MTFEEAAVLMIGGTGGVGKAKAKTITENGSYAITDEEKAEGYVGYSPITVDVPKVQADSDIISLINKLEPAYDYELFNGYREKLFIMPSEYIYPCRVQYEMKTDSSGGTHFMMTNHTIGRGISHALYKNNNLLYCESPTFHNYIHNTNKLWVWDNDKNTEYLYRIMEYGAPSFSYSGFRAHQNGYGTLTYRGSAPYHFVEYDSNGNLVTEYTTTQTWVTSLSVAAGTIWNYSPYKGDELFNLMTQTAKDFSDYALS